ncbi:acylphosphatase [Methylocapsa palsarum]|uniref:acylphosphatase n=1 Tax=Methylocapsa palsarum TaxID=1612308 RepID=UPI001FCE0E51|nr:acylphosphatase [Methylocapsa palsarum]
MNIVNDESDAKKTVRVLIGGRVQGVGYRAWVRAEAEARGIAGWVRNCSSGDVEALFHGPIEAVDDFCSACRRGPSQARVDRVDIEETDMGKETDMGDVSHSPKRFEIRF